MWAQWVCSRVENSFTYKSDQQPFFVISRDLQGFPLSVPVLQVTNGLWCVKWWNCKSVSVTWWHLWSTWLGPRGTCCVFQHASHIVPTWDWEAHAVCFSMHPTLLQIGTEKHMLCVSACVPHCSNLGLRGMCYVLHHVSHVAPTWDWEAHAMSCVSACIPHCSNLGLRGTLCFSMCPTCSNMGLRGTCCVLACITLCSNLRLRGMHCVFQHTSHIAPTWDWEAHTVSACIPHCFNLGLRGTHCFSLHPALLQLGTERHTLFQLASRIAPTWDWEAHAAFQHASHIVPTWNWEQHAVCFSVRPTLLRLGTERHALCVSACVPHCSNLGLRGTCYVF